MPRYGPTSTTVSSGAWRVVDGEGEETTFIWPRRRTVSRGRRRKSSRAEEKNVAIEYVVGVRTGSTPSRDRRNSGAADAMKVGRVLCKSVTVASDGGRVKMLRQRRFLSSERG